MTPDAPRPRRRAEGIERVQRSTALTLLALAFATALVAAGAVVLAGPARPANPASTAVLRGVRISRPVIAITVDDGPSVLYTREVLGILKRHHAAATFFVIGREAESHPELVREEIAAGCEVGSHTWSHPRMDWLTDAQAAMEVTRGEEALETITHRQPLYFRPPRGWLSPAMLHAAAAEGMRTVLWNVSLDHVADRTPRDAANRVLLRIGPGDVVLMHDGGGPSRAISIAALDILLTDLGRRGYRFVTLTELYKLGGVTL